MAEPVIEVDGLARTFRSRKGLLRRPGKEIEAVKGVSFAVERGELFGLLGPNGAGKTTSSTTCATSPSFTACRRASPSNASLSCSNSSG
jgi:ABC-type multidrug transport system ATPase subunit